MRASFFLLLPQLGLATWPTASDLPMPLAPRQWQREYEPTTRNRAGGPWNISRDDWAEIMAEPDLRGVFPISGYDITNGSAIDPIDGWTVAMDVRLGIPADGLLDGADGESSVFAGSIVRINPPGSIVGPLLDEHGSDEFSIGDDNWRVCYSNFRVRDITVANIPDDDGSCGSILTAGCIAAMQRPHYNQSVEKDSPGCRAPIIPRECDIEYSGATNTVPTRYSAWDNDTIDWLRGADIGGGTTGMQSGGSLHQNESLDSLTLRSNFMVVSWLHGVELDPNNVTIFQSVVCPRALNSSFEKDTPGGGDDDDNGSTVLSLSLTACLIGVGVSLFI